MTDVMGRPGAAAGQPFDLDEKYRADEGQFFFTGVQALVRVPLDQLRADKAAGLRTAGFISGYQGSPLGGFDKELIAQRKLLDSWNITHTPGLNEELGATAVMGSQLASTFPDPRYDGVVGIWYGKGPGLDRAGDAIRHANYAGTSAHGGVLALTGDDPACKSSTLPSASEGTLADLHVPTLQPGNVQEVLELGRHGVCLSRTAGLWCAIKIVTAVADGAGTLEVGANRISPVIPTFSWNGTPYRPTVTGNLVTPYSNEIEKEIYGARLELARLYGTENKLNEITLDTPGAWLGIIASGRVYYEVVEALRKLGLDHDALRRNGIRLLRMGMVFPYEGAIARRFADGLEEILVVEEKRPFLEGLTKEALYGMPEAPRIVGKRTANGEPLVQSWGALDADVLVEPLRTVLLRKLDAERLAPPVQPATIGFKRKVELLPARSPYFCSGCPHSTGTKVPDGALVGAGIGCHGMVMLMDGDRVGTITGTTQMGGEGTQWIGIAPFVKTGHYIQNIGDGTFAHSGSLALRASVSAGTNITYKILYNGAVAMTGGQDAAGAMPVPRLTEWLRSEGVVRTIVTTDDREKYKGIRLAEGTEVWARERIVEAQETLAKVPGVTVLIHDQQCAAEKRRDRKRGILVEPAERVVINERVCEGCGDCGVQSNCLSVQPIETEFGRKTQIHQSSCNKDYSCLAGDCPSFLTVVPTKPSGKGDTKKVTKAEGGARRRPALDPADLPEPTLVVPGDDATIRMPGIGGTGVVTVSQILGTAATLDGKYVWGLDQTGLSQKAGPVVSDLRITTTPVEGTNKVTAGGVDAYLVFDLLVGLSANQLIGAAGDRTYAMVSTSKTPTGAMITDVDAAYPDADLLVEDMRAATKGAWFLDAAAVAEGLFGETTTANVLQIGAAYQLGLLPISASAIEQAIELNGAAIEANRLAFRWGRMWAIDPERVRAASVLPEDHWAKPSPELEAEITRRGLGEGELGRIVRIRAADLVAYQDERYARRYLETVQKVAKGTSPAFAEAVARNLYKLMAYKDEYEVARLHLEEAARLNVENAVGADVKVSWNLHPPMLRAMGMDRKLRLGPWFTPVMRSLSKGKKLRGTPIDPFGYAKVRRVERQLVKEYRGVVEKLADRFAKVDADAAVRLAELPDLVRGYEDIKLRNVDRYHDELLTLRSQLGV